MKLIFNIGSALTVLLLVLQLSSCKKDKLLTDSGAKVSFLEDKVLFDTVFTGIGSATRSLTVRNENNQRIKISSITLKGGTGSSFIVNVDGSKGISFSDMEIAAHDSMYIFVQVNINPNNANSPLIVEDELNFEINGNIQTLKLEAWGQDAYYHKPTNAIKFKDGSYLPYSLVSNTPNADTVWKNDKPHVIYGFMVVDSAQKLTIQAGTRVYMNYKAGIWVYRYGQIQVLGQKGNEVVFQGARREKDFADAPGQWDRIWINEGSDLNVINYAIIKNGYVGLQAEVFGNVIGLPGKVKVTNTRIQNMSMWGMYCLGYKVTAANTVVSNCQEHCLNILIGGEYNFTHCTFANFWAKDKPREKALINLNNYNDQGIFPDSVYFGNCIIDGKRDNELSLDLKNSSQPALDPHFHFYNCWIKTPSVPTNTFVYQNVKPSNTSLEYTDADNYIFKPKSGQTVLKFNTSRSRSDALPYQVDIAGKPRSITITDGVTVGAYEMD